MTTDDFDRAFEYENGFYLTAPVNRFSKFVTHLDLYRRISGLPGEVVECGVFRGNSFCRLVKFRALLENPKSRKVIGFDTFGAFPEAGFEADKAQRAAFVAETEGGQSIGRKALIDILDRNGLNENIELIEGDILRTVPAYVAERPQLKIALLHIDVDLLEPTAACLEHLYPHVVRGGVVVLDDYGAFAGANKAIDNYFKGLGVTIEKLPFSHAISFVAKQ